MTGIPQNASCWKQLLLFCFRTAIATVFSKNVKQTLNYPSNAINVWNNETRKLSNVILLKYMGRWFLKTTIWY